MKVTSSLAFKLCIDISINHRNKGIIYKLNHSYFLFCVTGDRPTKIQMVQSKHNISKETGKCCQCGPAVFSRDQR